MTTSDIGYYIDRYNWSVRWHHGQWCLFSRQPDDKVAQTREQLHAIETWAQSHRDKFHRAAV